MLKIQERKALLVVIFVGVIMACFDAFAVLMIVPFFDVLVSTDGVPDNAIVASVLELGTVYLPKMGETVKSRNLLFLGSVSIIGLTISAFFRIYATYRIHKFIEGIRLRASMDAMLSFVRTEYLHAMKFNSQYNLQSLVTSDIDQLIQQTVRPFLFGIVNFFIVLIIMTILAISEPKLTFILGISFTILYFTSFRLLRVHLNNHGENLAVANSERFLAASATVEMFPVFQLSNSFEMVTDKFQKSQNKFCKSQVAYCTLNAMPRYIVELFAFSAILLIAIISFFYSDGTEPTNQITNTIALFGISAYKIQPAALVVYQGIANISFGKEIIKKIEKSLSLVQYQKNTTHYNVEGDIVSLRLKNVSHTFEDDNVAVLQNFTTSISSDENIVIVGPSGSGKSTLLNIIGGLIVPNIGTVEHPSMGARKNRPLVDLAPQATKLISGNLIDNLIMRNAEERPLNEREYLLLKHLVMLCKVDDFIPDMKTLLELKIHPQETKFSGGEIQRLSLVRALFRQPSFVLLDEPTSALNSETEQIVISNITRQRKGVVMITHSEKLIKHFDRCIHLGNDNGVKTT